MAKPVTHTVNFLTAAEEDLHRYTKIIRLLLCSLFIANHCFRKAVIIS